jgi:hypothetical protein
VNGFFLLPCDLCARPSCLVIGLDSSTVQIACRACLWLLPEWFHPKQRASVLTYYGDLSRWRRLKAGVMLNAVSRGQEFVLNCDDYPEAINWLTELLVRAAP